MNPKTSSMKFTKRLFQSVSTILVALLFFSACSDETMTGPDEDEPALPETSPAEVDVSYFEDANTEPTEEYGTFTMAEGYAQSSNGVLTTYAGIGQVYMGFGANDEAEYDNGVWTWEYTLEGLTIRMTAEDTGPGIEWNLILDGTDPETGQTWSEERFMYGFIAHENEYGEWAFFSDETSGSEPVLFYEWEYFSDGDYMIELTIQGEESGETLNLTYQKDGPEHTIESNGFYGNNITTIYWNSETGTGFIDEDGERRCWNEQYVNSSCE